MDPIALNLLCFLFGVLVGHRLSLWRDRRKEFNDVSQPLRELLLEEQRRLTPTQPGVTLLDADRLLGVLPWRRRRGFRAAWHAYSQAKQASTKHDGLGAASFAAPEEVARRIARLLRYTGRK